MCYSVVFHQVKHLGTLSCLLGTVMSLHILPVEVTCAVDDRYDNTKPPRKSSLELMS